MRESFHSPERVPEKTDRFERVNRFLRKIMFYGGGYQILRSAYLNGHDQLAGDVAAFFEPEVKALWQRRSRPGEAPSLKGGPKVNEVNSRIQQVDALLQDYGIDQQDRDQVVRLALEHLAADDKHRS